MAKQGSIQSQGFDGVGTEVTTSGGLDAALEPLLLVLEEPVGEKVQQASDAIGQILSSGVVAPGQVRLLADTEDLLDRLGRALEEASAAVRGGGA